MALYASIGGQKKKIISLYGNVNGNKKSIVDLWVEKEGVCTKVFSKEKRNKRFVTIASGSNGGYSYYSMDGETWVQGGKVGGTGNYIGPYYAMNKFMTIYGKDFYTSEDGITWTKTSTLPGSSTNSYAITDFCYGNGRLIAIQGTNQAYYSLDGGITWTAMTGLPSSIAPAYIKYGNDRFVTVGSNRGSQYTYYSMDGETWVESVEQTYSHSFLCYGNGKFITGQYQSSIFSSSDGSTWEITPIGTNTRYEIYVGGYGAGKYILADSSTIYRSSDGIAWEQTNNPISNIYRVCYALDRFIIVGGGSYVANAIYSLDGGITWTTMTGLPTGSASNYRFAGVCYG